MAATPAVTPGITAKGMPAAAQASASSPPPAEDEGIAALETKHASTLAGFRHDETQGLVLGHEVMPPLLAHEDALGTGGKVLADPLVHELIEEDHLGLVDHAPRPHREQARISGARTRDVHHSGHETVPSLIF